LSGPRAKILIVDDDETERALTGAGFTDDGLEVLEASSGVEALTVFEAQQPNIVMLDVVMPGMDGYATCAEPAGRAGSRPTIGPTSIAGSGGIFRA
jgi:CheY-like chemotaxis protein